MGVQSTAPHAVVKLVNFIGNRIFGSQLCLGINFGVNLCAPGRINFLKVCLIQLDNPVEMGLFGLVVERSQIPIALEKKVL